MGGNFSVEVGGRGFESHCHYDGRDIRCNWREAKCVRVTYRRRRPDFRSDGSFSGKRSNLGRSNDLPLQHERRSNKICGPRLVKNACQ